LASKIANNMILGINLAAVCEAVALGERLDLDMATLYEVVTHSTGDNWALRHWYPADGVLDNAPAAHEFTPGFKTSLLVTDLDLALAAGEFAGVPLDAAPLVHKLLSDHAAAGFADMDCSSLYLSLAKAAVKSRSDDTRRIHPRPCGVRKPRFRGVDLRFLPLGYAAFRYSLIRPSTVWRRLSRT
jgi:hypothetical protein